jgi:Na+/proline symporter
MNAIDWVVLVGTLAAIVGYGAWKERGAQTSENYLRGGHDLRWWTIGLSIMATQASAITFLSMPGQAYEDGMGFIQFYLGLPIAMVILSAVVLPIFHRLKVYTAYEYLEGRFDRKTRQLTAILFLVSRGLGAGVSIFAPAIVLSTVMGWPLQLTNLVIGGATIAYTVSGGSRTVSRTQTYQMVVMLGGMALAAIFILTRLPHQLSFNHTLHLAGTLGKMQVIDYAWRSDKRYTFWTGMSGGLFVALAYFGTDQSQVQRYLGGKSLTESRLGLVLNGLVKLPMQLLILFVGVLLFVYYLFVQPPLFFDGGLWQRMQHGPSATAAHQLDGEWSAAVARRRTAVDAYVAALDGPDEAARTSTAAALQKSAAQADQVRNRARALVAADPALARAAAKDSDYLFIGYVLEHFPPGLVGLLIAVIVCAAMSATASALSSLGSTSVVDFYRLVRPDLDDAAYVRAARWLTVLWGSLAVAFAAFAAQLDNLIQAVNILGSIFYGQMLGVFLVGFFLRWVRATPVFIATVVAQAVVFFLFLRTSISFLYYNVIGCAVLVALALLLDLAWPRLRRAAD